MKEEDRKYGEYARKNIEKAEAEGNKAKANGIKDKKNRICFYCGKRSADRHEVYHGTADRQLSLKMGFQVDLCNEHHAQFHGNPTKWGEKEKKKWREIYQRVYMGLEMKKGRAQNEVLTEWMSVDMVHENFLERITPP